MLVLGFSVGELLLCLGVFQSCWQWVFLALKLVSGCCPLMCPKPTDNECSWLFSWWVAAVPWCGSILLTVSVLGSPGCEWLLFLGVFWACWQGLFLALRMWVAAGPYCVSSLLPITVLGSLVCEWLLCLTMLHACWQCLSLALQNVSGCCALHCFKPVDNACSWLSSQWVAVVPCCDSSLLTMTVHHSLGCEWLLCLAVF